MSTSRIEASDLEEHQALSLMMVDGEPALWIWRSADWLEARDSTSPARWVSPSRARRPSRRSSASTRPPPTWTTFWRADPPRESAQEAPRRPQEPREERGGLLVETRGPQSPGGRRSRRPMGSAGPSENRGRCGSPPDGLTGPRDSNSSERGGKGVRTPASGTGRAGGREGTGAPGRGIAFTSRRAHVIGNRFLLI